MENQNCSIAELKTWRNLFQSCKVGKLHEVFNFTEFLPKTTTHFARTATEEDLFLAPEVSSFLCTPKL